MPGGNAAARFAASGSAVASVSPPRRSLLRCPRHLGAWPRLALSLLTGLALALSFPLPGLTHLVWIALLPLFAAVRAESRPARRFLLGYASGLAFFGLSLPWLYGTLTIYGQLPPAAGVALVGALVGYLALYHAAFAAALGEVWHPARPSGVFWATILFVALEYLREHLLTGFPWNSLGYALFRNPLLIQIADLTGVHGVSLVIVLVNAGLYCLLLGSVSCRSRWAIGLSVAAVVGSSLVYGNWRLHSLTPNGHLRVALVQGNIAQDKKWDRAYRDAIIEHYGTLTARATAARPELIIWPEASAPFIFSLRGHYRRRVEEIVRSSGCHVVLGAPERDPDSDRHYNTVYLLSPIGQVLERYDKVHLVPFGEYVPLPRLLFFVEKLVPMAGDFGGGGEVRVMRMGEKRFGVFICYEAIFPNLVRQFTVQGVDFLVNVTNDAWFGLSSAPYQHFANVVLRAVENRRAVARCANTGISGVIDASGRIIQTGPLFLDAVLIADLPLYRGRSIYVTAGDWCPGGCLLLCCLAAAARWVRRKRGERRKSGGGC